MDKSELGYRGDEEINGAEDEETELEKWERGQLQRWQERWGVLNETMHGFDNLVWMAQGMLVGASLASGEIWETRDMMSTLVVVEHHWMMMQSWGFER